MEKKHVYDKRAVKLEEMLKSDYIPLGSGRPERDVVINEDDVRNLVIALNTAVSLEDLISKL